MPFGMQTFDGAGNLQYSQSTVRVPSITSTITLAAATSWVEPSIDNFYPYTDTEFFVTHGSGYLSPPTTIPLVKTSYTNEANPYALGLANLAVPPANTLRSTMLDFPQPSNFVSTQINVLRGFGTNTRSETSNFGAMFYDVGTTTGISISEPSLQIIEELSQNNWASRVQFQFANNSAGSTWTPPVNHIVPLNFARRYSKPPLVFIHNSSCCLNSTVTTETNLVNFWSYTKNASGEIIGCYLLVNRSLIAGETILTPSSGFFKFRVVADPTTVIDPPTNTYGVAVYGTSNDLKWKSQFGAASFTLGMYYTYDATGAITAHNVNADLPWACVSAMLPQSCWSRDNEKDWYDAGFCGLGYLTQSYATANPNYSNGGKGWSCSVPGGMTFYAYPGSDYAASGSFFLAQIPVVSMPD